MQDQSNARREALAAQLADGISALTDSGEWHRYLDTQARFHSYSFGNTLLIARQCPDATRVNSYRRWQDLGRQVRKGERAIWIWAPCTRKAAAEDDNEGETRRILSGFRPVAVFDIGQTDGEDLPEVCHLLDGGDEDGVFGALESLAAGIGFTVALSPEIEGSPGANGVCDVPARAITIASARSPLQMAKSLAHEIGHALLHTPGDGITRGVRELEAESVAYIVAASLGLDTSAYSFGYVAEWAGGDGRQAAEAIKASGGRIQRAAGDILTALEKARELVAA